MTNPANSLLNWGFSPVGSPLGSDGALSMPTEPSTGLGDPMAEAENMLANFSAQTERRYGNVSNVEGGIWDPRGANALSREVADYKTSDLMRPDEIAVQLGDSSLDGGDPVLAPYLPDSSAFADALYAQDIGLSPEGAGTLAESLGAYDKKILDTIYLPRQVEPQVTNAIGLTSSNGGLPRAFFDPTAGSLKQGMPEAIDRVIAQSGEYQYVDPNGVVDKYGPGTDPYSAMRMGLIPGTAPPPPITAAQARAYPGKLSQSPGLGGSNAVGNPSGTGGSPFTAANGGGSPFTPSGGPNTPTGGSGVPVPLGGGSVSDIGGTNGSNAGFNIDGSTSVPPGTGPVYGDATETSEEAVGEKKCSKWWWLLALIPVGAGAYYMSRKGKKRGRK